MQANSGGQQQGQQGQQGPQGQQGQQVQQGQQAVGQQQPNQQQVATGGTGGGATTRRVCGSKPPKFTEDGVFDLYQAQVEGYLVQHGCWDVVAGNAVANAADPQWMERNQFARYALLFGMLPKDSKKVCKMTTAREIWTAFEQDKTKRAYASEIRLRRDLYAAKFQPGEGMETYLNRLEGMRRQLANMNAVISDADMVSIVLQGVVDSHRNVVRLFNRNNTGAAPNLATVGNVLLGEDETDKACAVEVPVKDQPALVTKVMTQRPVPPNPKKKFKKKGGSGKKVNDETRKCFFCKKKGHLRADCYGWKALQAKKGNDSDASDCGGKRATPLKLVWSGELGDFNNQPVPIRMAWGQDQQMPAVNSVHEWMLDGGAGAHVCVNANSFTTLVKDPLLTIDWQGGLDTNERSGLIVLDVANGKILELHGVRYAPGGVTNLICQRLLERTGWKPSYFDTDDERQRSKYFDKNDIRLEFKKRADGFYWMVASPVLKLSVMAAQSVETSESNIVMRWHLKLAHLNEAAMKNMVKEGLADGMDGLTLDSFNKTPLSVKRANVLLNAVPD
ncbi:hypothetical protein PF002_g30716 [Phytophthora fragariae]|uniref:CCHC-type domain-containing protein n=1 Tax=Phytophthora fragariae TaxID=53985 RepID=A0A6A3VL91_9STRA|nr:hypothetical protein PF002_g30716 [Phytophthora fragariae]